VELCGGLDHKGNVAVEKSSCNLQLYLFPKYCKIEPHFLSAINVYFFSLTIRILIY